MISLDVINTNKHRSRMLSCFFRETQQITGVVETHITVHVNGRCCFKAKIMPRALCTHHMIQGSAWLVDPQPSSKMLSLAFGVVDPQAEYLSHARAIAENMQVTCSSAGICSKLSDTTTCKNTLTDFSVPLIQTFWRW